MQAGGHEAGKMGHVDHQQRADLVGDLAKHGKLSWRG